MATIETIPLELYLNILDDLSAGDLLSLKRCSKAMKNKTNDAHLDKLLHTRTYSLEIEGLEKLFVFSQHPMGRLKLKRMVLRPKDPRHAHRPPEYCADIIGHEEFTKLWERRYRADRCPVTGDRDLVLLGAAFADLPNLETIEFCNCPAEEFDSFPGYDWIGRESERRRPGYRLSVPNRVPGHSYLSPSVHASGSAVGFRPKREAIGSQIYNLTMSALPFASFKLKAVQFHDRCVEKSESWIDLMSFHLNREGFHRLSEVFAKLKVLKINVKVGFRILGESLADLKESQRAVLRFAEEAAPSIKNFSIAGQYINSANEQMQGQLWRFTGYRIYAPTIRLDNEPSEQPVTLRYLRNLHLDTLVFRDYELKAFLLRHQPTIRQLTLHKCLLESEYQTWSQIFQFVGAELSLDTFEYEIVSRNTAIREVDKLDWLWRTKAIPWFRFYGDVRTNGECCEFLPKEIAAKGEPPYKVNFTDAMDVVAGLENRFVLGGLQPARWSEREESWWCSGHRNLMSSGDSEILYQFHQDPLFRLFIRPGDIREIIREVRLDRLARSKLCGLTATTSNDCSNP